jgi:hypothetical protein
MTDQEEVWDQILDAVRGAGARPDRLEQFLVHGALLVTPAQFQALHTAADEYEMERWLRDPRLPRKEPPVWAQIPVIVVPPWPAHPTEIGDKVAVNFEGTIYVLPKDDEIGPPQRVRLA